MGLGEVFGNTVETQLVVLKTQLEGLEKDHQEEVAKHAAGLKELKEANEKMKVELDDIKKQKDTFELWLKVLGVPLAGLTIFNVYLWFVGIKRKAEEEVEVASKKQFAVLVKEAVDRELATHPAVQEFFRIKGLKEKTILVISKESKDADFEKYLEDKGFTNTKHAMISELNQEMANEFKLFIFNNEKGTLEQGEMNAAVNALGKGLHYFYFKGAGENWENDEITMKGYATTRERLEGNLVNALE